MSNESAQPPPRAPVATDADSVAPPDSSSVSPPDTQSVVALRAIQEILISAARCSDEADFCQVSLAAIEKATDSAFGWIGELNPAGTLDTIAMSPPGWDACRFPDSDRPLLTKNMVVRGIWGEVLRTGEPLITNDPVTHPAFIGLPEGHPPLTSFLGVPLRRDGEVFGMIALGNKRGGFDERDLATVTAIAPAVAEMLEATRLRITVAQHAETLEEVVQARTDELSEVVNAISEQSRRFLTILDAHPEIIYVADPDTYEVMFANKALREQIGRDPVGGTCYEEFQDLTAPCEFCTNHIIRNQPGTPHRWEHYNETTGRHYDVTNLFIPWTDGHFVRFALAVDITDRKLAERQLQTVIDTSVDGFAVCDSNGTILAVNKTICRMLGYTRDELVGMHIEQVEDSQLPEQVRSRLEEVVARGSGLLESRHRRKDGSVYEVEVSTTYLPIEDGRFYAFVRDISERRAFERERERMIAALSRSNTELEQFAYSASHDLQEPLRKVQAFGDRLVGLLSEETDERVADHLQRMGAATVRMRRLIDDLLALSRVTTQAKPFEPVDLQALCDNVLSDLEIRIERTGGSVRTDSLPTIDADATQMHMLLLNLIGNALKFHRDGVPPVVAVEVATGDETITLTVSDNGIGFDQNHADRIFKIFQRLHTRDEYEGTGIGLALCEKIAHRHGGSINARGRPGEGAVFEVTLPRTHQLEESTI